LEAHSVESRAESAALGVRLDATHDALKAQLVEGATRAKDALELHAVQVERRVEQASSEVAAEASKEAQEVCATIRDTSPHMTSAHISR